ncbi:hypothetical protein RIF29_16237 [Crotalaria pallida]|uniref:Replication protein A 70 kDa DNA-binding subunit B/D first OB fold domain-containing protein n=1 Tax=Crotalaria pallida TaxID=3830 RepID=A0AAN9FKN6_CROPI
MAHGCRCFGGFSGSMTPSMAQIYDYFTSVALFIIFLSVIQLIQLRFLFGGAVVGCGTDQFRTLQRTGELGRVAPHDDSEIKVSCISKLTPGKHVIKGSRSSAVNHVEQVVSSSSARMVNLFGGDENRSVRRFAECFGFNDPSGGAVKAQFGGTSVVGCGCDKDSSCGFVIDLNLSSCFGSNDGRVSNDIDLNSSDDLRSHIRESPVVDCCSGKKRSDSSVFCSVSKQIDLNSMSDASCVDGEVQFEKSGMDRLNYRITFEIGSSSRSETRRHACEDDCVFVVDELDEVEDELLEENEVCEDDDDEFVDECEPFLEMIGLNYHGVVYSDLGDCDCSCCHCGAKFCSSMSGAAVDCASSIVEGLKEMIDEYNPIAKVFRMTRIGRELRVLQTKIHRAWDAAPNGKVISINMILCDKKGDKIHAIITDQDAIKKHRKYVEEGRVIQLSRFYVAHVIGTFRPTKHEYRINVNFGTNIEECRENIACNEFEFISFEEINMDDKVEDTLKDVVGVVKEYGSLEPYQFKGQVGHKLMLIMANEDST